MKTRLILTTLVCAVLGPLPTARAASGDVDPTFDPGSSVDKEVRAVAVQPDGKILIGGDFNTVRGAVRPYIARLNADGTVDATFNPGAGPSAYVSEISVLTNGQLLVAGAFSSFNGTSINGLARLNPDGSLDHAFNPVAGGGFAIQPDGKILVTGAIRRLNGDGSLDNSFNPGSGANSSVYSVAVQADGKVLIGGSFTSVNGTNRQFIARLNADGSLDSSFTPGYNARGAVVAITVQPDGRVLVGQCDPGPYSSSLIRLNSDGSLDYSFDSDPNLYDNNCVQSLVLQPDGNFLVGGSFYARCLRATTNGTVDNSFTSIAFSGASTVNTVALQPDGKVLIGGDFSSINLVTRNNLARLNADGSLDTSFVPGIGVNSQIHTLAAQSTGKVLIPNSFSFFPNQNLARLNLDGSLDATIGPIFGTSALLIQPDGKILFGTTNLARLNADGSLDGTFKATNAASVALAVQVDGKVVTAGSFHVGTNSTGIARFNTNGARDTGFTPPTMATTYYAQSFVNCLAIQPDGKILLGGGFNVVNGTNRYALIRLNLDGSLDSSFNPTLGIYSTVQCIAVQFDGKILIGGSFGVSAPIYLARLNADGSFDGTYQSNPGPDRLVYCMVLQPDGKVAIGGSFRSVNGASLSSIARLNADGSVDAAFIPGLANGAVYSIALEPDAKLVVGGAFTSIGAAARGGLARLLVNDPPAIIAQPASSTNYLGASVSFGVTLYGPPPFSYQWFFNSSPLSNATNALLTLTSASATNAGDYFVVVSNAFGSVTSSLAALFEVPQAFSSILRLPDKTVQLSLNGGSNLNYRVDASTDLFHWAAITNLPDTSGTVMFVDRDAVNYSRRFYRAVWVP